jgi:hypothetical protein
LDNTNIGSDAGCSGRFCHEGTSVNRQLESIIRFEYSVFVLKTLDSMHMAQHWILTILPSNHLTKIELGRNYLTTIYTAILYLMFGQLPLDVKDNLHQLIMSSSHLLWVVVWGPLQGKIVLVYLLYLVFPINYSYNNESIILLGRLYGLPIFWL